METSKLFKTMGRSIGLSEVKKTHRGISNNGFCNKCQVELTEENAYKRSRLAKKSKNSNFRETCKKCWAEKAREYRLANIERERTYTKWYYASHKEERKAYKRKYYTSDRGREVMRNLARKYKTTYPDKYLARQLVRYALRKGQITKGVCEECGEMKVQAHHEDYSKPLQVKWLCILHHKIADGKYVEPINS